MSTYDFTKVRALVIDDSVFVRRVTKTILRSFGVTSVIEASSGAEALDLLSYAQMDLVICDLEMAPVGGIEFVKRMRRESEQNAFVPVIVMTAHTDAASIYAARDAGATEFLAKPVSPRALADRIAAVVERPRPFVRNDSFFGPDRRRRQSPLPGSPQRRVEDGGAGDVARI
jgi:two-component system, chemotaxis family, chemotaxis protein CheY